METVTIDEKPYLTAYHTQYCTDEKLTFPERCKSINSWLGIGYYFWTDIIFAHYWGEDFKKKETGYYDIYKANLDTSQCLNCTFNADHYFFFKESVEKAIQRFKDANKTVTLQRVHDFLRERFWTKLGVTGIIYDDLPTNPNRRPNRKYSVVEYEENGKLKFFYYHKRIQIVIFNKNNIHNFALHLDKLN